MLELITGKHGADDLVHFVDVGCGAGAVTNQAIYYIMMSIIVMVHPGPLTHLTLLFMLLKN